MKTMNWEGSTQCVDDDGTHSRLKKKKFERVTILFLSLQTLLTEMLEWGLKRGKPYIPSATNGSVIDTSIRHAVYDADGELNTEYK